MHDGKGRKRVSLSRNTCDDPNFAGRRTPPPAFFKTSSYLGASESRVYSLDSNQPAAARSRRQSACPRRTLSSQSDCWAIVSAGPFRPCHDLHFFGRDSMIFRSGTRKSSGMIPRSGTRKSSDMIFRSGTRKSSVAMVLAVSKVSISLSGSPVSRKSSDFRYERCG